MSSQLKFADLFFIFNQGNNILVADNDRAWADLGHYPDNCFPQPDTCSNGMTISLWYKVNK